MSGSKGGDKKAEKSWIDRVLRRGKGKEAPQQGEGIDPEIFLLANKFGDMMRDPGYAELPGTVKTKLRAPVEQQIEAKDKAKLTTAIDTFKGELAEERKKFAKSVNDRIVADGKMVDALTSRGSHGVKQAADPLKAAKTAVQEGRVGAAAAQLDIAEEAIGNEVGAYIGLAEGRINSLTDWGAPEAGDLENRAKALRANFKLENFTTTMREYDTLMRDVAAASTVPAQQQKTRGLGELRKGIVTALAALPDPPPPPPKTGGDTTDTPPKPPPPRPGGTPPTGGTPPKIGGRLRGLRPPPPPPSPKPALQQRFDTWDKELTAAGKETDAKKKDTALDKLDTDGTQLYSDILRAKGGDTRAEREDVYKKALEARYGFTVATEGHAFTNLDKMYEVLRMVPAQDVAQSKLTKLTYTTPGEDGAAYGGATIFMGDYGDAKGDWDYTNPDGTPAPVNGFGISALHELGHSIDDRNGIMRSNRGKPGCGAWQPESVDSVAQVYFTVFRFGAGKDSKISDDLMKSLIVDALNGAAPTKPDTVSDTDWSALKTVLDTCASLRADAPSWPWGSPKTVGGRSYHQSYKESNEWWSYDPSARNGTTVRTYQWRSPVEWFAELYAFTHFKKQKPPAGVDSGVAVFMWKP